MAPSPLTRSRPEEGLFVVPGGYVDDAGIAHRDVVLRPLTGRDEAYLAALPADTPAAAVTTQLLARSIERLGRIDRVDAALVREMLVGDRDFLLLKVCELAGTGTVYATLACPSPACGRPMDVPLALADIPIEERPAAKRVLTRDVDGRGRLEFRLPTGGDQEALAGRAGNPAVVDELLARCVVQLPDSMTLAEAAPWVEEAMSQAAPRLELEIEARCPECGAAVSADVDIVAFLLSELAGDPNAIRQEVHVLAWHYHWPESEILALTPRSRRRYIDLISDELLRANG